MLRSRAVPALWATLACAAVSLLVPAAGHADTPSLEAGEQPFSFQAWNDNCPDPPGADTHGCPVLARLSRIDPDGTEHVLIQDWCAVYSTHTIADLRFGPDGALYASGGDGAHYQGTD